MDNELDALTRLQDTPTEASPNQPLVSHVFVVEMQNNHYWFLDRVFAARITAKAYADRVNRNRNAYRRRVVRRKLITG